MLTASECEWLENRRNKAYCRYCNVRDLCSNPNASGFKCPLISNYKEAVEFSERMTVKMAKIIARLVKENPFSDIEAQAITPDLILKWARLSVEKEMDNGMDI